MNTENSSISNQFTFFIKYTLFFSLLSLFVFSWYIFTGKNFVYDDDGIRQYLPVYIYWSNFLKETFHNIFVNHDFIIRQWDFSIGEGSDIISTLSYNIVGDPFCFFAFLIPAQYMHIYYNIMSLLRLFCSGLAFSLLCFHTGKQNKTAIMAGTLSYTFFQFAIFNVARHPHFLNAMIYFPLLVLGAEKILKREKPFLFIAMVFIAAMTSFYFFYMEVLLIIVYVIIRLFSLYKRDFRKIIFGIRDFFLYGLFGTCGASVILLPTIYAVLQDSRQGMGQFSIFYDLRYYLRIPVILLTARGNHWLFLGFTFPVLAAIYYLFKEKSGNNDLKKFFIVGSIFILLPACGLILNGIQYPSNRWCWAFALLCCYILVCEWSNVIALRITKKTGLLIIGIFSISAFFSSIDNLVNAFIQFSLFLIFMNFLKSFDKKGRMLLFVIMIGIFCNAFFLFSNYGRGYAETGTRREDLRKVINNETHLIKKLSGEDGSHFYRFSGHRLTSDANMVSGISSIQYYISLTNPKIQEFRKELAYPQAGDLHIYEGYDTRAILDAISSVKYFYNSKNEPYGIPYGFSKTKFESLYKNDFSLPLAFTYNSYIPRATWNTYSPLQKQEALLQGVVLDENKDLPMTSLSFLSQEIPIEIETSDSVQRDGELFAVTKPNSHIYIRFSGLPKSETYMQLSGLEFSDISEIDLARLNHKKISLKRKIKNSKVFSSSIKKSSAPIYFQSSSGIQKKLDYKTKYYTWSANRHLFQINLGYSDEKSEWIKIEFQEPGTYTIDSIKVFCQPMTHYQTEINDLKKSVLENEEISINKIKGSITVEKQNFLYFSIPYAKGWTAFVDGKKAKLEQANIMHMGLLLEKGTHTVTLQYHTPFLRAGAVISLMSIMIFAIIFINSKHEKQPARISSFRKLFIQHRNEVAERSRKHS